MSISSISSSSLISRLTSSSSTRGSGGAIATAAKVLGMSTDDVTSALRSGSSLADLATKQGISADDLVSALVKDAPDDIKNSSDATKMITSMVESAGMKGPDGSTPPAPSSSDSSTGVFGSSMTSSQKDTLSSVASLLGTDSDSLTSALKSGTSLSDLFEQSGVSYDQLAGVIQSGLLIDTTA